MEQDRNKQFVKALTKSIKEVKDSELIIKSNSVIKKPKIDEKYISMKDYKEVVGLYNYVKELEILSEGYVDFAQIENDIFNNSKKFKYLKECCEAIYNFVSTLRFYGPINIAKEMTRIGRANDKLLKD